MKLGPTGQFPEGKLNVHDEGELKFAIGEVEGNVCIYFSTPITWLGLGPEKAVELAQHLIHHARNIAKKTGTVLTVEI